jgi:hypothetical protein
VATNNPDPTIPSCDAIVVPPDVTLKIDASQGMVKIYSHGAAIKVDGGHLVVTGTSDVNSALFDAEPDVASWDGIVVDANAGHERLPSTSTALRSGTTAKDNYGNTATGYAGTVAFTSTDSAATLPSNYTFVSGDNGTQNFTVTLQTPGAQTVTATDNVTASISGSVTVTVN